MLGQLSIQKLYGGQAYTPSTNSFLPNEGAENEYSRGRAVIFCRPGFEGHIAPAFTFDTITDSTGTVTATPMNGAIDSSDNMWAVLRNARLVKFSTSAVTAKYDITPAAPNHSGHTVTTSDNADVITFKDTTPNEWIVSSWEDSSDADISIVKIDGSSPDNDWFSTLSGGGVLTKGVPLKMWIGPDGILYCTNGRYLASANITGAITAATGNAQALDIEVGWVATSGCSYQNFNAFVAYKSTGVVTGYSGESKLYLWDGFSPSYNATYDIGDYFVSKVLTNEAGELFVFTFGKNNTTKLKQFTGNSFVTIWESALIGSPPYHGGADKFLGNHLFFGTNGVTGGLQCWGAPTATLPNGLHFVTSTAVPGMVKNLYQNRLFLGLSSSIVISNMGKYANGGFSSNFLISAIQKLPPNSAITCIRVYFSQFGTGASVTLGLYKSFNSVSGATDYLGKTLTNADYGNVSYIPIYKTVTNVNQFVLLVAFDHADTTDTAAIIERIEVEYNYEPTN